MVMDDGQIDCIYGGRREVEYVDRAQTWGTLIRKGNLTHFCVNKMSKRKRARIYTKIVWICL